MIQVNSRADLEAIRGTPDFEIAMRGIYGSTVSWTLVDGAWVKGEDLSVIPRLGFTSEEFAEEIEEFDFPPHVAPVAPKSNVGNNITTAPSTLFAGPTMKELFS